jgi:hypothetical protein
MNLITGNVFIFSCLLWFLSLSLLKDWFWLMWSDLVSFSNLINSSLWLILFVSGGSFFFLIAIMVDCFRSFCG